jgi:hypothetical protein
MVRRLLLLLATAIALAVIAVGCHGSHAAAPGLCARPTLKIAVLDPAIGPPDRAITLSVLGTGFVSTPSLHLGTNELGNPIFVDANRITARVPAGLEPGDYDLVVTDPGGACGLVIDGFHVAGDPPPRIDLVTPARMDVTFTGEILVEGTGFRTGAKLLVASATTSRTLVLDAIAGDHLRGVVATPLPAGIYRLSVTNLDEQDAASAVLVTETAGRLALFRPAGAEMAEPRVYPGFVDARDDGGRRLLYAIGGSNQTGFLASVEAAAPDELGRIARWTPVSALPSPRWGAGVARDGDRIYAAGGTGPAGGIAQIARARVAPSAGPAEIAGADAGPGPLEPGTWYYRVSALDPRGAESPASGELTVRVAREGGAKIFLTWTAVEGASGYRVYRNPDPASARSGTERRIAQTLVPALVDAVAAPDAGASAPPEEGSLSAWEDVTPPGMPALFYARAAVADAGGPHLLVVGTVSATGGTIALSSAIAPDGSLGPVQTYAGIFPVKRIDFSIAVTSSASDPGFTGLPLLTLFGGRQPNPTGNTVTARVTSTGGLIASGIAQPNMANPGQDAGTAVCLSSGRLYAMGGGNMANQAPGNLVNETTMDATGKIATWTGGNFLGASRYGNGAVCADPFVFVVGGFGQELSSPFEPRPTIELSFH